MSIAIMVTAINFGVVTDYIQASNGFGQPAEDQVRVHIKRMKVFIVINQIFHHEIRHNILKLRNYCNKLGCYKFV